MKGSHAIARLPVTGLDLASVEWIDVNALYGDVGFTTAPGEMVAVVSEDPATGASTVLIKLPPGWKSQGPERHTCLQEELLLEGDLSLEGRELAPFSYLCFPAGHVHGPLSTRNGCIVLAWHDGPVDVEYLGG